MSILGYSSSYFLPSYWAGTPLYGEKIIPLIDYILSNDYEYSEKLAQAYYSIASKYTNTQDLPIEAIKEVIRECGYSYILDLLGNNRDSLVLLVNLIVLIHQLKGTKLGIEVVLNLLKKDRSILALRVIGDPSIDPKTKEVSGFSENDYVIYDNFEATTESLEINVSFRASNFESLQCIASVPEHGLYLGLDGTGRIVLALGSDRMTWNISDAIASNKRIELGKEYKLKLLYTDGFYYVQVASNEDPYVTWLDVESPNPIGVVNSSIYIGVDVSEGTIRNPFSGAITFSEFSIDMDKLEIVQWFEQDPVGPEDTFLIRTDLDLELVSADFFQNFAKFVRNYVYPSLQYFEAGLTLNASMTFIPFVREKITFVAESSSELQYQEFLVKSEDSPEEHEQFLVKSENDEYISFEAPI